MSINDLESELFNTRALVKGKTFSDEPIAFRLIEALKVRIALLRDPQHFQKKRDAWAEKRASYRHRRAA